MTQNQAALSYRDQRRQENENLVDGIIKEKNNMTLHQCNRQDLVDILMSFSAKYRKLDTERLELKRLIADATSMRHQFESVNKSYKELQEAHVMQARHLQKLQKHHGKVE